MNHLAASPAVGATAPRPRPADLQTKDRGLPAGIAHKAIPFEVRGVDDGEDAGTGSFTGLGAAFLNLDADGDILDPGAFDGGLKAFLADGFIGGVGHDWGSPIGHPAEARATPEGLHLKAVFDGSPDAQAVRAKMRVNPQTGRSTIRKLSIGYVATAAERMKTPADVRSYWEAKGYTPSDQDEARLDLFYTPRPDKDGKPTVPGARLLRSVKLYEVSPVVVPANDQAEVRSAKGALLGDTDRVVAFAAMERLLGMLGEFLWMTLAGGMAETPPDPAEQIDRMYTGIDEFRDALTGTLELLLARDGSTAEADDAAETTLVAATKGLRQRLELPEADDPRLQALESLRTKAVAETAPTFADHSRQVVSAVQGFLDRADSRVGARFKEGRMLSRANLDEIGSVADQMESGSQRLRGMVAKATGDSSSSAEKTAPDDVSGGGKTAGQTKTDTDTMRTQYRRERLDAIFHRARRHLTGAH